MRLYFETPDGHKLAIDTDKRQYATGANVEGVHRFIWLDSEKDLQIILSELDFDCWAYGSDWTRDTMITEADAAFDPFHRPPRTSDQGDTIPKF